MAEAYTERSGKFRHIYGEPMKKSAYEDLRTPQTSGEGMYVAVNRKYVAYAGTAGGGPLCVIPLGDGQRGLKSLPGISVHKGKVWDMDFHPFINNIIVSGGDDCRAELTMFPPEGITETINESTTSFEGHMKKVTHVKFGKVSDVLATASFDQTAKIWNVETAACVTSFEEPKGAIQDLQWNEDSTLVGVTSKDKKIYCFDPRSPSAAHLFGAFDGTKSQKMQFLSRMGWVMATGFSKTAKRELKIWDLRDTTTPLSSTRIDAAASVLVPHWDNDLGVLYTVGKGEGTISYYEIVNDATKLYPLSSYRKTTAQKGGAWMPKAACDVWRCEVQRFYKLTKTSIIPIQFMVPRKAGADIFQDDIFPDCFAHKPALTADEFLAGENSTPKLMEMDPAKRTDGDDDGSVVFKKKATYKELEQEYDTLKSKYDALKKRLADADDSYVPSEDDEKSAE